MSANYEQIARFLRAGLPPASGKYWEEWKRQCKTLGHEAIQSFLVALREGSLTEQEVALLALREFGYETWQEGRLPEISYCIRQPETKQELKITPRRCDIQESQ